MLSFFLIKFIIPYIAGVVTKIPIENIKFVENDFSLVVPKDTEAQTPKEDKVISKFEIHNSVDDKKVDIHNVHHAEESINLSVQHRKDTRREKRQFSFFTEPEEDTSRDDGLNISDPAEYYAKIQKRKKKRPGRKGVQGSYSSYKKSGNKKLNYAFLKPETYPAKDSKDCKPASPISAFTFLNFAMAAGSVAANIIANVNDNNNNNNNNNNDNNDNSNNFNVENNSNNANNANTIMLPVGRRRRKRMIEATLKNFINILNQSSRHKEARNVLATCRDMLEDRGRFCERNVSLSFTESTAVVFHSEVTKKIC